MTLTPRRNLPPDAEEWGRHVDKTLADLRRKTGIADTNVKSVILSNRAAASSFSNVIEDIATVRDELSATNDAVAAKPDSQRTQFPPENPKHGDHWLNETNTLHIYVDYGTLPRRNYIHNPTLHLNADTWTVSGGTFSNVDGSLRIAATGSTVVVEETVSRSVTDAVWSASANINFVGLPEVTDPEYAPNGLGPYTVTVDVVGTDATVYSTGSFDSSESRVVANADVEAVPTSAAVKVRVTVTGLIVDEVIYLDQFLLEAATSVSEYFDATMPGVEWDGDEGLSPSYWNGEPRWVELKDRAAISEAIEAAHVELEAAREILNQADADLNLRLDSAFAITDDLSSDVEFAITRAGEAETTANEAKSAVGAAIATSLDEYVVTNSSTTPPPSDAPWSSDTPDWTPGQYVWRRTKNTHIDGTVTYSAPVVITGADGTPGEDAVLLRVSSSRGVSFKNNAISTVLTVTVFKGSQQITNINDLWATFGSGAYLEWWWRRLNDTDFGIISSSDSRLSQAGFALTVSPADVDEQTVFQCILHN